MSVKTLTPFIQCYNANKEAINLSLKLIETKLKHFHPFFVFSDEQIVLRLHHNNKTPQFNVYQTTLNEHNIWRTDCITNEIFYKTKKRCN